MFFTLRGMVLLRTFFTENLFKEPKMVVLWHHCQQKKQNKRKLLKPLFFKGVDGDLYRSIHKSIPYSLCTIFQVFWSHVIALCEEQTQI